MDIEIEQHNTWSSALRETVHVSTKGYANYREKVLRVNSVRQAFTEQFGRDLVDFAMANTIGRTKNMINQHQLSRGRYYTQMMAQGKIGDQFTQK